MRLSSLQGRFVRFSNWGAIKIWFIIEARRENNYQIILDFYATSWSSNPPYKETLHQNSYEFSYSVFQRNAFQEGKQIDDGIQIYDLKEEYHESVMRDFIRANFNV